MLSLGLSTAINLDASQNGHYRWTDANGTVQYADRPPEGVEAEFIKFTGAKSPRSSEKPTTKENIATKAELPPKMEVLQKKDPELCKQAQQNLKALEGARIRITEADGSKRFLTEEEKEYQRENARKFVDINC
jgi:hypothetical protein